MVNVIQYPHYICCKHDASRTRHTDKQDPVELWVVVFRLQYPMPPHTFVTGILWYKLVTLCSWSTGHQSSLVSTHVHSSATPRLPLNIDVTDWIGATGTAGFWSFGGGNGVQPNTLKRWEDG